jgi:hypothetical protein
MEIKIASTAFDLLPDSIGQLLFGSLGRIGLLKQRLDLIEYFRLVGPVAACHEKSQGSANTKTGSIRGPGHAYRAIRTHDKMKNALSSFECSKEAAGLVLVISNDEGRPTAVVTSRSEKCAERAIHK